MRYYSTLLGALLALLPGCCVAPALRITNCTPETVTIAANSGKSHAVAPNRSVIFPLFYNGVVSVTSPSRGLLQYVELDETRYSGRRHGTRFSSDFPCFRTYSDATLNSDWSMRLSADYGKTKEGAQVGRPMESYARASLAAPASLPPCATG